MGYADRDYFRDASTRPPGRLAAAPVVKWLLVINLGVFLIEVLFSVTEPFNEWGAFTVQEGVQQFQLWRLITFQFLHADFGHLLFNSIAIFVFGSIMEEQLKSKTFLIFYLACGVVGALNAWFLAILLKDYNWFLVGASAGVFGILVIAAISAPTTIVRLIFPPVSLSLRRLARIFLFIGLVFAAFKTLAGENQFGEAGHFGGALAGLVLWKVPVLRTLLERLGRARPAKARPKRPTQQQQARGSKRYEKKLRPKSKVSKRDATEVDRILDKINEHGLHSLTQEERELLTRAGKK